MSAEKDGKQNRTIGLEFISSCAYMSSRYIGRHGLFMYCLNAKNYYYQRGATDQTLYLSDFLAGLELMKGSDSVPLGELFKYFFFSKFAFPF